MLGVFFQHTGRSKIKYLELLGAIRELHQKQVMGLEIPVDHARAVGLGQQGSDLLKVSHGARLGVRRSFLHACPLQEFHGQEGSIELGVDVGVEDLDQMRGIPDDLLDLSFLEPALVLFVGFVILQTISFVGSPRALADRRWASARLPLALPLAHGALPEKSELCSLVVPFPR
jgi:hypothetical protein